MKSHDSRRDFLSAGLALPAAALATVGSDDPRLPMSITASRKAVPQRAWAVVYCCTFCGVSSTPAS